MAAPTAALQCESNNITQPQQRTTLTLYLMLFKLNVIYINGIALCIRYFRYGSVYRTYPYVMCVSVFCLLAWLSFASQCVCALLTLFRRCNLISRQIFLFVSLIHSFARTYCLRLSLSPCLLPPPLCLFLIRSLFWNILYSRSQHPIRRPSLATFTILVAHQLW